jgi:flagellar basal body L-ring protein FlgH
MKIVILLLTLLLSFGAHGAVNTEAQNAKAVLDALADTLDSTVSNAAGLRLVERFTDTEGDATLTNEEKAAMFNDILVNIIRSSVRAHTENAQRAINESAVVAAGDSAEADLE